LGLSFSALILFVAALIIAKEVCLWVGYALLNDSSVSFMIFSEASDMVRAVPIFFLNPFCADTINTKFLSLFDLIVTFCGV
jgi:hypothetical protein